MFTENNLSQYNENKSVQQVEEKFLECPHIGVGCVQFLPWSANICFEAENESCTAMQLVDDGNI